MDITIKKSFFEEFCSSVFTAINECSDEFERVVIDYFDWRYSLIKKGKGYTCVGIDLPILPCRKLTIEEFMDLILQRTKFKETKLKLY